MAINFWWTTVLGSGLTLSACASDPLLTSSQQGIHSKAVEVVKADLKTRPTTPDLGKLYVIRSAKDGWTIVGTSDGADYTTASAALSSEVCTDKALTTVFVPSSLSPAPSTWGTCADSQRILGEISERRETREAIEKIISIQLIEDALITQQTKTISESSNQLAAIKTSNDATVGVIAKISTDIKADFKEVIDELEKIRKALGQ